MDATEGRFLATQRNKENAERGRTGRWLEVSHVNHEVAVGAAKGASSSDLLHSQSAKY